MRKTIAPTEAQEQEAFVQYFRLKYPNVQIHTDFGSGTRLSIKQASQQRRQNGGLRGWPDITIPLPVSHKKRLYYGLYIEFKKTGTRLNKKDGQWANDHIVEQALVLDYLNSNGYCAVFARGYDEAVSLLETYMKQDGSVVALDEAVNFIRSGNDSTWTQVIDIDV